MKQKKDTRIEDLLREKEKIEKSISEQFKEHVTIMFTDIVGYTNFVETHGDIVAKSLLQKHNDIIFAIIEKHSGFIIKTIGDAIMASFSNTKNGVNAAVEIQKTLKRYNENVEKIKKINIRIGIHAGNALKDGNDYFGDAVNIAARIEPTGSAGQIMVSDSVYSAVKHDEDILCSHYGLKEVKGKVEPIEIYRVFLTHDEKQLCVEQKNTSNLNEVTISRAKLINQVHLKWKIGLPVIFFLIFLFVYSDFFHQNKTNSSGTVEKYIDGFTYLKNGDYENARIRFLAIGDDDPLSQEGLAAIAYKTREYNKANILSEKLLSLNPGRLYSRVIKGNILFDNGKYNKAERLYKEASELDTPVKWQKGEAFFRLGRISSFLDNPSKALEYYNSAITYDEKNIDIITAKGVLLEKMGELTQAMASFQAAQALAPENAFVNAFQSSIQQKLKVNQDKEQQERINVLVDELILKMKQNNTNTFKERWTSRPATLFFARMERKGIIPLREGQDEFFKLEITERLRRLPTVDVVDRELLDKLLQELKISSSDLADGSTALELGRIISAQLIGNLTFIGFRNETRLYLKLIETETSAIKISISRTFDNNSNPDKIISDIVEQVAENLKSEFPLRGKIRAIDGSNVIINIGSNMGVSEGMIMRVFSNTREKKTIGTVNVISVEPTTALGKIIQKTQKINTQNLLEAVPL